jgi:hypothetical protein
MSCIEWQTGEVLLPTAALTTVKKALREAANKLHEQAQFAAHDFWDNYAQHTRSQRLYSERLETYMRARVTGGSYYGASAHPSTFEYPLSEHLRWLLEEACSHPHKLTHAEVERYFPRANSRSERFRVGEGHISFEGRTLKWSTGHNKNVVEEFAAHPLGVALFKTLREIKWTRGSGGRSWGSDEYAEDAARDHGGNPVHECGHWGVLGERAQRAEIAALLGGHRRRGQ